MGAAIRVGTDAIGVRQLPAPEGTLCGSYIPKRVGNGRPERSRPQICSAERLGKAEIGGSIPPLGSISYFWSQKAKTQRGERGPF